MDLTSFAATGIINSLCENPIFNAKYASLIIFNIQQVWQNLPPSLFLSPRMDEWGHNSS